MTLAFVTGATGMLGRHVIDALLAASVEVRALARLTSDIRRLKTLPVEIVSGDPGGSPGDRDALRQAVRGADWVFHLAGQLSVSAPFGADENARQYMVVNVGLTEALLAASLQAGVGRFIYASSASVYGIEAEAPIPEDAPLQPASQYGLSKLRAEERIRACQKRGLPATIIRSPIIYGPGDRYFTPAALRLARLPVLPLVNGGRNRFDLVYARDVAELMLRACQTEAATGRAYNAGPPEPTSLHDLIETYRQLTGRGPRIIPISNATLQRSAWLPRWFLARFMPGAEAMLTPTGLALISRDIHLDLTRARTDLNYTPRFTLREGLDLTLHHAPGSL